MPHCSWPGTGELCDKMFVLSAPGLWAGSFGQVCSRHLPPRLYLQIQIFQVQFAWAEHHETVLNDLAFRNFVVLYIPLPGFSSYHMCMCSYIVTSISNYSYIVICIVINYRDHFL